MKKTKENIDNLFKSGAENYPLDYNSKAWEDMKNLLDKRDKKKVFFLWFLACLGSLLVVGAVIANLKIGKDPSQKNKSDLSANQGNLVNKEKRISNVKDKLLNWVKASGGNIDYDVIGFNSSIKSKSNATLSLLNYDLKIRTRNLANQTERKNERKNSLKIV